MKLLIPASCHVLLLSFLLFVALESDAQKFEKAHSFTITHAHHRILDDHISSEDFKGTAIGAEYSFSTETSKKNSSFHVGFETGNYSNTLGDIKLNSFRLQVLQGFALWEQKKIKSFTGYGLNFIPSYSYSKEKYFNRFSWNSTNSISFYQLFVIPLNKNSVDFSVNLPLLAAIYQTDGPYEGRYGIDPNKVLSHIYDNQKLATINSFKSIHASAHYQLSYTKKLRIAVGVNYDYTVIKKPAYLNEGFLLGIKVLSRW